MVTVFLPSSGHTLTLEWMLEDSFVCAKQIKILFFPSDLEKVVLAFAALLLDECNTLHAGLSKSSFAVLVHNAAVTLQTKKERSHYSKVCTLAGSLCIRVQCKVALFVFKWSCTCICDRSAVLVHSCKILKVPVKSLSSQ